MQQRWTRRITDGFTLIELLVISVVVLMVLLLIPGLNAAKQESIRRRCVANLKQVGLAFRTSNLDGNGSEFFMQRSVQDGGTKELIDSGQVFVHYRVMSNELSTPKILVCPADKKKTIAKSFDQGFTDRNVSNHALGSAVIGPQSGNLRFNPLDSTFLLAPPLWASFTRRSEKRVYFF